MTGLSDNLDCMSLFALGISHQTAPVAIRERLAFTRDELPGALRALQAIPGVRECGILSTCNRTEIYAEGDDGTAALIIDWMHTWHQLSPRRFAQHIYTLHEQAAVIHLIKVCSGMDSMVLGEPQIAGQLKQSWQLAREAATLGPVLDRLYQHAFASAKRVRTETGIGHNPVTLPFAALKLARQIFGDLDQLSALMIGAGEMTEECANHFASAGLKNLRLVNRRPERLAAMAERFGTRARGLDELGSLLEESDIVVTSTASSEPILQAQDFRKALRARRHRPVFVLDLAVPRDVEPATASLADVYLFTIDDLQRIVETNHRKRDQALGQANEIADSEASAFRRWLNLRATNTTLKSLRGQAMAERDRLLDQARRELAAGRDFDDVMQRLAHRLTNRLLHIPSIRLRKAAESADESLLSAARFFFDGDREEKK